MYIKLSPLLVAIKLHSPMWLKCIVQQWLPEWFKHNGMVSCVVSLWNCQTTTWTMNLVVFFYLDVQGRLCNLQRNNAPSLSVSCLNNRSGVALWCLRTIHLFTVSLVSLCLNTFLTFQRLHSIQKSAKSKKERVFFFTPTATADTQWSLESYLGLWGGGGGNNGLYCPSSIGIQWRSVCLFLWTTVSCGRTVVVRLTRSDAKSSQVLDTEQKSPQGRHIKETSPKKTAYMLL